MGDEKGEDKGVERIIGEGGGDKKVGVVEDSPEEANVGWVDEETLTLRPPVALVRCFLDGTDMLPPSPSPIVPNKGDEVGEAKEGNEGDGDGREAESFSQFSTE